VKGNSRVIGTWFIGAALLCVGLAVWYLRGNSERTGRLLREARRAVTLGEYARGEELARRILAWSPRDGWALLIAAEAAIQQGHRDAALEYYLRIPDDGSEESISGLFGAGELLCHAGRLTAAEAKLRRALEHNSHYVHAHLRLAFLLGITGRRWESVPHYFELLRSRHVTADTLVMLGDRERVVNDPELLASSRRAAPDDPLPRLGEARLALVTNRLPEAAELLESVMAALPEEAEAQVRMGSLLLDTGRAHDFLRWQSRLPTSAVDHPVAWIVFGRWFQERHDLRTAARCFWEAVVRDPDDRLANYRLGQTLVELEQAAQAQPFLKRAELLQRLATVMDGLFHNNHDAVSMYNAALLTESLGRIWEAWGWGVLARAEDPGLEWALQTVARLEPELRMDLPVTLPASNPARQIDLSSYPLPDWRAGRELSAQQAPDERPPGQIRFANVAAEAGIEFVYFNSPDASTPGARIIETTGGGVAAFDFDGDAWPDLYLTQGCRWPAREPSAAYRDRLFRNRGDSLADDVTDAAGLGDTQFSQGISAGDYDNDGFPDLYLANLGCNRLYRNNGDGTFADVTAAAGISGDRWTTSCLIADLNGDSWPDIYDVTYCSSDQLATLLCPLNGTSRACSPRAFSSVPDQLYLNQGDGTFENVSAAAGIDVLNGYGLGIVAADFERSGRLNVFVANDEVANFYFVNQTESRGGSPAFVEQALVAGLAFDADGLAHASMGVAAGDADGNRLVDLYITGFYNEPDALYLQQSGGLFIDATRQAGIRDPSFAPLGFGAQFLDADLDGRPDLVLTTGHVDDLRAIGQPYEMSPQLFRNIGGGRFIELKGSSSPGKFFDGKYLGRGLARLDWNRDGKEDFAVSHIGSPAALVVNRTEGAGHFLAIQLRGVKCDRDAIGTHIEVTAEGRTRISQLTAGDGYQATNERRLVIGLGNATRVDRLMIRWLSGTEQAFRDFSADVDVLLIEGRDELIRLPSPQGRAGQ
jgi:tetratricopeptide (TPR) repeat protein